MSRIIIHFINFINIRIKKINFIININDKIDFSYPISSGSSKLMFSNSFVSSNNFLHFSIYI